MSSSKVCFVISDKFVKKHKKREDAIESKNRLFVLQFG